MPNTGPCMLQNPSSFPLFRSMCLEGRGWEVLKTADALQCGILFSKGSSNNYHGKK